MFSFSTEEVQGKKILDCPAGACSFTAVGNKLGGLDMSIPLKRTKTPKLPLTQEEKRLLRSRKIKLSDIHKLEAEHIAII